jgi:hypothetical protein
LVSMSSVRWVKSVLIPTPGAAAHFAALSNGIAV